MIVRKAAIGLLVLAAGLAADPRPSAAAAEVLPPSRQGATVARIVVPTLARGSPSSTRHTVRLSPLTEWSQEAQRLLVLRSARSGGREWLRVRLGGRPDGAAAWVPRNRVVLRHTPYWIEVRTASRRLTVFRAGEPLRQLPVVVGAPATPTPHGLAAIYEKNRQPDPHGFLGPWVLSLTAFSRVLHNFDGGPGRVAIHGRSGAGLAAPLGSAGSAGCVRVENRQIVWMAAHIPVGTPVRLRR